MHGFGPIRVQQDGAASCLEDQVTTNNYSEHPSPLIYQTHPRSEMLKILNLFLKKTFAFLQNKQIFKSIIDTMMIRTTRGMTI